MLPAIASTRAGKRLEVLVRRGNRRPADGLPSSGTATATPDGEAGIDEDDRSGAPKAGAEQRARAEQRRR